jgi:O-antigen/teichoic acid export membrane protein
MLSLLQTLAIVIRNGVVLLSLYVFAKGLNVDDFGLLSLMLSGANLINIFLPLAIGSGIARYVYETNRPRLYARVMFFVMTIVSSFNLIIIIVIHKFIFPDNVLNYGFYWLVFLIGFSQAISETYLIKIRHLGYSKKFIVINFLMILFYCGLTLYLFKYDLLTIRNVLIVTFVQYLPCLVMSLLLVINVVIKKKPFFRFSRRNSGFLRKGMVFSVYIFPVNILFFSNEFLSKMITNFFIGLKEVGLFTFVYSISFIVSFVFRRYIYVVFVPFIFQSYKNNDFEKCFNKKNLEMTLSFIFLSLGILISTPFLFSFFQPYYLEGIKYVPFMLVSGYLSLLPSISSTMIQVKEKVTLIPTLEAVVFCFSLVFHFIFVFLFKLQGVFMATGFVFLVRFLLFRYFEFKISNYKVNYMLNYFVIIISFPSSLVYLLI